MGTRVVRGDSFAVPSTPGDREVRYPSSISRGKGRSSYIVVVVVVVVIVTTAGRSVVRGMHIRVLVGMVMVKQSKTG